MNDLHSLRHSCAHLLAAAVLKNYPTAKLTIGPSTDDGFYYDIDFDTPLSEDELPRLEKQMHNIVQTWKGFESEEISYADAKKKFADNPYKLELIEEIHAKGEPITLYTSGDFTDLCRGGHVEAPSKALQHFKLLSLAGAYWRGSEKNKMLTRIYGTAFETKDGLNEYLEMLEEAKKRDHRKLGQTLSLFMFHETSPGMPYWLPKGLKLYNALVNFWRVEHEAYGYQEIASPLVNKSDLWKTSGHWNHYKDDMFIADMGENEVYGIKPMNCPNAMVVFSSMQVSYKDLPLRLSDTDRLHRYERSGTLNGLFRVRSFQQDDSHNFISEEMIQSEYEHIFEVCEKFYGIFGLTYTFRLGTRPEKFMGDIAVWDRAEKELKQILDKSGKEYFIEEGDGAFYGPKVDIVMKDSLGRDWQMGTIQLDFQIPMRFGLSYTDSDGSKKTPIVVHRVIYGSLERFIGILIEHTAGAFPVWLAPTQVVLLPVSEKFMNLTDRVAMELKKLNIRVEVDDSNKTLGAKIRTTTLQKVPYMCIIGSTESDKSDLSEDSSKDLFVTVRTREGKDLGMMPLTKFALQIQDDIENKK